MRNNKNNMPYLILPAVLILCAGCTVEKPIEVLLKPNSSERLVNKTNMPTRFQDAGAGNPSAVESAMELSAKYVKTTEELAAVKTEKQQLVNENQALKDRLTPCQGRLTQAQKELAEANDLLIEMRIELNNWKTNILGFRDEIRQAERAQIEALAKILQVLGGEAKAEPAPDLSIDSATTSPNDPNNPQPALQTGTTSGQFNG